MHSIGSTNTGAAKYQVIKLQPFSLGISFSACCHLQVQPYQALLSTPTANQQLVLMSLLRLSSSRFQSEISLGRFRRTRGNILLLVDGPEVSPMGSSHFRFCQPHSTFSRRGSYLASVLSLPSKHNQMIGPRAYLLGYNFSQVFIS